METMTYAAACTERLRLGCAVLVSPLHSPAHLALSVATVDQLSGGRLEVGIGTGGRYRQFSAVRRRHPFVARFNEGLELMRKLWTEDRVTTTGASGSCRGGDGAQAGAAAAPADLVRWRPPERPAARRRPRRRLLRRRLADDGGVRRPGAHGARALAAADRDPATFRIAKRVYVTVDDDAERGPSG